HSIRPLPLRDSETGSVVDLGQLRDDAQPTPANSTLDRLALAERAEQQSLDAAREEARGRIDRWQTRLLELSLRTCLLNLRATARTVRFSVPDVSALEDALPQGAAFTIHPRTEGDDAYSRAALDSRHLFATEAAGEVQKRLLTLYRTA